MRRVAVCLSLATAAAGLAGCGSNGGTAKGATAPTSAVSPASMPSPTSATSGTVSITRPGPGVEIATDWGSVTYFGQQRPAATAAPAPEQAGTE